MIRIGRAGATGMSLLALLSASLVLGAAPAAAQSMADSATIPAPTAPRKPIAGAKKEGTSPSIHRRRWRTGGDRRRSSQYGIKVTQWRGSSEDIRNRALTDIRAAAMTSTSPSRRRGHGGDGPRKGAAAGHHAGQRQLIPQATFPHHSWIATRLSVFVGAYNTGVIKPADAPKSYEDLRNPKYKGKLGIEADDRQLVPVGRRRHG